MSDLQQVLQVLEPRLRRHRPLARAGQQLLFDLAGLLSGLRSLIMLDTAPGATPAMLQQVLEPVADLMPDFQGCVLHLDGCCYLANIKQLQERLAVLASDTSSWPLVVNFRDGQAAITPVGEFADLQQQVQALATTLQQQVPLREQADSTAVQLPQPTSSNNSSSSGRGFRRVLDMSQVAGLPVMPTLHGFLLSYPAVYWARDVDEAAVASRVLSASVLQLFSVRALCNCCTGGQHALLSFTVPAALCDDSVDRVTQTLLDSARKKITGCAGADGCAAFASGTWKDVCLTVEAVGPRPISL